MRFPRHVDGISDYEANLAHKLIGQSLRALRGKTTRVQAVYSGSVDTSLPYAQFVASCEGVSAPEYSRESTKITCTHFKPISQGSILKMIIANNGA